MKTQPTTLRRTAWRRRAALMLSSAIVSGAGLAAVPAIAAPDAPIYLIPGTPIGSPDYPAGAEVHLMPGTVSFGNDSARDMTIAATVTDQGALEKNGTRSLLLSSVNSYQGGTIINDGELVAGTSGALPVGGMVAVRNTGTLTLQADQTIGALTGNGTIRVGDSRLTVGADGSSSEFTGSIRSDGIRYKGSWKVSDGPNWSGGPTPYSGVAAAAMLFGGDVSKYMISTVSDQVTDIDHKAWIDVFGEGAAQVAEDYVFNTGGPGYDAQGDTSAYVADHANTHVNYAFASEIGNGGLAKVGAGTLTLSGINTYLGVTEVIEGTLAVAGGAAISDQSTVAVSSGATFHVIDAETIGGLSGEGAVVVDHDLTVNAVAPVDRRAQTNVFNGTISGAGGLIKTGDDTLRLGGTNSYTGGTRVDAGTLIVTAPGALTRGGAVAVGGTGTLKLEADQTIGALTGNGTINLGNSRLTVGADGSSSIFAGSIGSKAFGFVGSWNISTGQPWPSNPPTYTGQEAAALLFGGNPGDYMISTVSDQIADINHKAWVEAYAVSGASEVAEDYKVDTGAPGYNTGGDTSAYVLDHRTGKINYAFGDSIGTGGLTKVGGGTLTLTGVNTYVGTTEVAEGTLAVAGGQAISDKSQVLIAKGATFHVIDAEAIGGLNGEGTAQIDQNLTVNAATDSAFAGTITGAGGLIKTGAGMLTLTGVNDYRGNTVIAAGTLRGNAASISGDVENHGALIFIQNEDASFGGVISGDGGVGYAGTGTLRLTGANTYTGATEVANGRLVANSAIIHGNIGTGAGGTFEFAQDFDGTFAGGITASGGRIVKSGNGTLTVTGALFADNGVVVDGGRLVATTDNLSGHLINNATVEFRQDEFGYFMGPIDGTGTLIKSGAGTVGLANTVALAGGVKIMEGGLTASPDQLKSDVENHGVLTLASEGNGTYAGKLTGDGQLVTYADEGTMTLTGDSSAFTGNTTSRTGNIILSGALGGTVNVGNRTSFNVVDQGNLLASAKVDGTLGFLGNGDLTYGGVLSGNGSVVKQGQGTLTLTGTNSFGGALRVNEGKVVGTTASLTGSIANNGTVEFAQANDGTFAGTIWGSGTLIKSGTGVLTLAGDGSEFTGQTQITNGTIVLTGTLAGAVQIDRTATLQLGNDTATGNLIASTVNNGLLIFARPDDYIYSGALSGDGTLVKRGDGVLTLAGDYQYRGATVVQGGKIVMLSALPTTTDLQMSNGTFDLNGRSQTVASLSGEGGQVVISPETVLTINQNSTTRYAGTIAGNGILVKSGAGSLDLRGENAFSGNVQVQGGRLAVNGTLAGNIAVASGGTLGGNGTMGGIIFRRGATAAPGNSIGTIHSTGDVTFEAGSTYQVEVDATGAGDKIVTTGKAIIQGGNVQVLAAAGNYKPLTHYTLVSADQGVQGKFDGATSNLAFLSPMLGYDANTVFLDLVRNDISFTDIAETANQRAVAGKASGLGVANPIYRELIFMSAASARETLDQLSGEIHPSARNAMVEDTSLVRTAVLDRMADAEPARGVWLQGLANWSQNDFDGNAAREKSDTQGILGGLDIAVGAAKAWRVGVAGGYAHDNVTARSVGSTAKLKSTHVLGYAAGSIGGFKLRIGGGYAHVTTDTVRNVAFGALTETLKADYDANLVHGFGEIARPFEVSGAKVEPFANVAVVHVARDGFAESAGTTALKGGKTTDTTTQSALGTRFEVAPMARLSIRGKLAWEHVWGTLAPKADLALTGTTGTFGVAGASLWRNAGALGLDAVLRVTDKVAASVGYDGRLGTHGQAHAAKATLSIAF